MKIEKLEKKRRPSLRDNLPYMHLFIKEHELSFTWDTRSPEIEVSRGGFGEKVEAVITGWRPEDFLNVTLTDVVDAFVAGCRAVADVQLALATTPGADGAVHLGIYRTAEDTAFLHNLDSASIGVCPGGYGEPVTERVHPVVPNSWRSFGRVLEWFEHGVCEWVDARREVASDDEQHVRISRVLNSFPRSHMQPEYMTSQQLKDDLSADDWEAMWFDTHAYPWATRMQAPGYTDATEWAPQKDLWEVLEWVENEWHEAADMEAAR